MTDIFVENYLDPNNVWCREERQMIFCADFESGFADFVLSGFDTRNPESGITLHSNIAEIKGKLILSPFSANEILIFDIESEKAEYIMLPDVCWGHSQQTQKLSTWDMYGGHMKLKE